ncbi:hypothetical protein QJQ45_015252, partial [Haematococcus lacustris]
VTRVRRFKFSGMGRRGGRGGRGGGEGREREDQYGGGFGSQDREEKPAFGSANSNTGGGSAGSQHITAVILRVIDTLSLDVGKLVAFCSDGASTFLGAHNGVIAKLQQQHVSYMVVCLPKSPKWHGRWEAFAKTLGVTLLKSIALGGLARRNMSVCLKPTTALSSASSI